ncbi:MAG: hypothetical protein Tsb0020_19150 [Haliangiales bacterium]
MVEIAVRNTGAVPKPAARPPLLPLGGGGDAADDGADDAAADDGADDDADDDGADDDDAADGGAVEEAKVSSIRPASTALAQGLGPPESLLPTPRPATDVKPSHNHRRWVRIFCDSTQPYHSSHLEASHDLSDILPAQGHLTLPEARRSLSLNRQPCYIVPVR